MDLGKVAIVPAGEFVDRTAYERLDMVTYGSGVYIAKEDNQNVLPTDSAVWMKMGEFANVGVMTSNKNGIGHPDDVTIKVDSNGEIRAITTNFLVVPEKPYPEDAKENIVYLVADNNSFSENRYKAYMLINNSVECINATPDLSDYLRSTYASDIGGKNLLPMDSKEYTENGITIQTDEDTGLISLSGTATADTRIYILGEEGAEEEIYKEIGTLMYISGTGSPAIGLYAGMGSTTYNTSLDGEAVTIATEDLGWVYYEIKEGTYLSDSFKPMICPNYIANKKASLYTMTQRQLTVNAKNHEKRIKNLEESSSKISDKVGWDVYNITGVSNILPQPYALLKSATSKYGVTFSASNGEINISGENTYGSMIGFDLFDADSNSFQLDGYIGIPLKIGVEISGLASDVGRLNFWIGKTVNNVYSDVISVHNDAETIFYAEITPEAETKYNMGIGIYPGYVFNDVKIRPFVYFKDANLETWIPPTKTNLELTADYGSLALEVSATKKSVSDGKELVADAITDKGVQTATDASFQILAENIGRIETGGGDIDTQGVASFHIYSPDSVEKLDFLFPTTNIASRTVQDVTGFTTAMNSVFLLPRTLDNGTDFFLFLGHASSDTTQILGVSYYDDSTGDWTGGYRGSFTAKGNPTGTNSVGTYNTVVLYKSSDEIIYGYGYQIPNTQSAPTTGNDVVKITYDSSAESPNKINPTFTRLWSSAYGQGSCEFVKIGKFFISKLYSSSGTDTSFQALYYTGAQLIASNIVAFSSAEGAPTYYIEDEETHNHVLFYRNSTMVFDCWLDYDEEQEELKLTKISSVITNYNGDTFYTNGHYVTCYWDSSDTNKAMAKVFNINFADKTIIVTDQTTLGDLGDVGSYKRGNSPVFRLGDTFLARYSATSSMEMLVPFTVDSDGLININSDHIKIPYDSTTWAQFDDLIARPVMRANSNIPLELLIMYNDGTQIVTKYLHSRNLSGFNKANSTYPIMFTEKMRDVYMLGFGYFSTSTYQYITQVLFNQSGILECTTLPYERNQYTDVAVGERNTFAYIHGYVTYIVCERIKWSTDTDISTSLNPAVAVSEQGDDGFVKVISAYDR